MIDAIRSFATGFIFTTSLPPCIAAGSLASIKFIKENDILREKLHANTQSLRDAFSKAGIPIMACSETHILPVLIGNAEKCKAAAERLLKFHGIYIQPINYPSVPVGTERFRINATPAHTETHIARLAEAIVEVFQYLSIPLQPTEEPLKVG